MKAGLTDCMKKESHFQWTEAAHKLFDALKNRIVKAPVLASILKSSLKWSQSRRVRRVWRSVLRRESQLHFSVIS